MLLANKKIKYWKYSGVPNATKTGSPTVDNNGITSGFSSSNYYNLPELFNGNIGDTWEIVFKIKLSAAATKFNGILSYNTVQAWASRFAINSDNKLYLALTTGTGDGQNVCLLTGTTTISANTWYWVKAEFTGSAYNIYISTNGTTWNLEATKSTTTKWTTYTLSRIGIFGDNNSSDYPFNGQIDLKNSYIKSDNREWWRGTTIIDGTSSSYDFTTMPTRYFSLSNKIPKYWKYLYVSWTQPVLTSNNTTVEEGTITTTASSNNSSYSNIYAAMDGVKSGTNQANVWMTSNSSTGWWQVKFPYKIKITGLTHYNSYGGNSNDRWVTGQYFTSSDKTTPIGNSFTTGDVSWESKTIEGIPSSGVITDTIYFSKTDGATYSGIGELEITATKQQVTESTSSDYDYITITERYFSLARKLTKYWKYVDTPWTQPNLTSNISSDFFIFNDPKLSGSTISDPSNPEWGTAAVSNFANIWQAMDGNTGSGYWTVNAGNRIYSVFDIIFKNPLKITQIYIDGTVIGSVASSLTGSIIYDMSSDSPVLMSYATNANTNTHTYSNGKVVSKIRICCRPNNDGGSYPTRVKQITITASEQVPTESTSSNYDYSKIITQY